MELFVLRKSDTGGLSIIAAYTDGRACNFVCDLKNADSNSRRDFVSYSSVAVDFVSYSSVAVVGEEISKDRVIIDNKVYPLKKDSYDDLVREHALSKLNDEEKRVLGLGFPN